MIKSPNQLTAILIGLLEIYVPYFFFSLLGRWILFFGEQANYKIAKFFGSLEINSLALIFSILVFLKFDKIYREAAKKNKKLKYYFIILLAILFYYVFKF